MKRLVRTIVQDRPGVLTVDGSLVGSRFACEADEPAGGSDGISIAPALEIAAALTILAVPLFCGAPLGPKSLKRIPAVAPIATIAVIMTGLKSPRRSLLCVSICCLAKSVAYNVLAVVCVDQQHHPIARR
jgi:hypothetical protein